jgi:hypothetical protein
MARKTAADAVAGRCHALAVPLPVGEGGGTGAELLPAPGRVDAGAVLDGDQSEYQIEGDAEFDERDGCQRYLRYRPPLHHDGAHRRHSLGGRN